MAGVRLCDFTKKEIDFLEENCNFTPEELEVFRLRTKNKSVVEICMTLNISESTAQRRIRTIKKKIVRTI